MATNRPVVTYTEAQVRLIIASKEREKAQLQTQLDNLATAKDKDIALMEKLIDNLTSRNTSLIDRNTYLEREMKAAEQQVRGLKAQLEQVKQRTTVTVSFKTLFSSDRMRPEGVRILLIQTESMKRAMWDFADRSEKFHDHLQFTYLMQLVWSFTRVAEVSNGRLRVLGWLDANVEAQMGLTDGDVIEVELAGEQ